MPEIPLKLNAYYIFDRDITIFANLFRIHTIGACS